MKNNLQSLPLIGYACGIGAGNPLCSKGPLQIESSPFLSIPHHWVSILTPKEQWGQLAAIGSIIDISSHLAENTAILAKNRAFFVTIGGDHSCAIGTWSGVAASIAPKKLGLLWIDAHLDSHTLETTPSGNIHGMPLAILLGRGEPTLVNLMGMAPKLLPENVCILGIRSYEPEEKRLLEQLNVDIYYIDEINSRGFFQVLLQAVNKIKRTCDGFGISLDLDAIDPDQAPGVGTPVEGGINLKELYQGLDTLAKDPLFLAAEIAEFNPILDKEHKTEMIIVHILKLLLNGVNQRVPE